MNEKGTNFRSSSVGLEPVTPAYEQCFFHSFIIPPSLFNRFCGLSMILLNCETCKIPSFLLNKVSGTEKILNSSPLYRAGLWNLEKLRALPVYRGQIVELVFSICFYTSLHIFRVFPHYFIYLRNNFC